MRRWLIGLLLALLVVGCGDSGVSTRQSIEVGGLKVTGGTAADAAAFRQIHKTWIDAYLSGDLDTLMTLHDEQTVLMPRRNPDLKGLAAIRGFFEGRIGQYEIDFQDELKELEINRDWAFLIGHFSLTGTPKAGGEVFRDQGRYFVLYRKDRNGQWKIYRDIDNSVPAAGK